jgi:hypothetical protein
MAIRTNKQLAEAWTKNNYQAIELFRWNGCKLMVIMEGGMIHASIYSYCGDGSNLMCKAPQAFRFVQQASAWFYEHVDYMER